MRCVWLKAWDRAERLPWTDEFHELRPPVDNRLWGTSSWANWVTKRDRQTPGRVGAPDVAARGRARSGPARPHGGARRGRQRPRLGRPLPRADGAVPRRGQRDRQHLRPRPPLARSPSRWRSRRCGEEPVLQLVCRDRNRLALQSEIVGAALHGIENICCLTGDDVTAGDEPEARRVFDLDGPQLLETARGHRGGPLPLGPPGRPGAAPLPRRRREPGRAAVRAPRRARAGRRPAPARASSSSSSASSPSGVERFVAEAVAQRADRAGGAAAVGRDRPQRLGAPLHRREGARDLDPGGDDRAGRARRRPAGGGLRASPASSPSTRSRCRASPACT